MTRILVAEDNDQSLYMLQMLLSGHGHEVVTATNGAEALEKARREPPEIIISDILMPVMDGFTLCRQWKSDERFKNIPFVFYTATYTDPKDEEFALNLGADRFIVKPADPDAFLEMLREVLAQHESGKLAALREPVADDVVVLREYNQVLIGKLEDKLTQLEEANRELGRQISEREQAEEALRNSKDDWENIFESISDVVVILDRDHRVLDANRAALAVLDRPKDEITGQFCYALFHCAECPPEECPHEKLLCSEHPETTDMEMQVLDGVYLLTFRTPRSKFARGRELLHIATPQHFRLNALSLSGGIPM